MLRQNFVRPASCFLAAQHVGAPFIDAGKVVIAAFKIDQIGARLRNIGLVRRAIGGNELFHACKRGVEQTVLGEIVRRAAARGISALRGKFLASGRNELVRDHYAKLGFSGNGEDWELDIATFEPAQMPLRVVRRETTAVL